MRIRILSSHLLSEGSRYCSMGMFDNWMGQKTAPADGGGGQQQPVKRAAATSDDKGGDDIAADGDTDAGTDDKLVQTIWDEDKGDGDDEKRGGGGNEPPNNQQQPDPDKQVADYLKGVGLEPIKLSEAELEAFKSGEGVQGVLDSINTKLASAHIQSVSAAQKLMDKKIKVAVDEALGQSATLLRDDKARTALQNAMPWTKAPEFARVAEGVLKTFLSKTGNDIEKSVRLTKIYFQKQQAAMDPDAVLNTNTGDRPRRRTPQESGGVPNWVSVLTGKNE